MKTILMSLLLLAWTVAPPAGDLTAKEIVAKADKKMRGETNRAEMAMKIVRPSWVREIQLKAWSKGTEYSLILVTAPARDKGTAFLKREKEIWNWQPTIDRVVKLPPSMMMQSWMGSDFTNDDLVKESSIVNDYTHELAGRETVNGRACYKIDMTPKPDAAVVWGKVITWIDTQDFMQLKAEFYDEDGYLVNTMLGKDIKKLGGKLLPATLEMIPADKEGHKTVIRYEELTFDEPIQTGFFSVQNMKRVR